MSAKELSSIVGVGRKTTEEIIRFYGSEELAQEAIRKLKFAEISSIPGVGPKTALKVVERAFENQEKVTLQTTLKTPDIRSMYRQILEIISSYLQTEYARAKLSLYYPLPKSKLSLIEERLEYFTEAAKVTLTLPKPKVERIQKLLNKLKVLKTKPAPKRVVGRIVVTDNAETMKSLQANKIGLYSNLYELQKGEPVKDLIKGYDLVIFLASDQPYNTALDYADNVLVIEGKPQTEEIAPEIILSIFTENFETIQAACELAEILQSLPPGPNTQEFLDALDLAQLKAVGGALQKLDEKGKLVHGINDRFDRYSLGLKDFQMKVEEIRAKSNEQIIDQIQRSSVTIKGEDVVKILEAARSGETDPTRLKQYIPSEISDILIGNIDNAEDRLCQALNLKSDEVEWAEGVFVRSISLPVQINQKAVTEMETTLRKRALLEEYKVKTQLAMQLAESLNKVNQAVQTLLDFDLFLGVGLCAHDFNLNKPLIDTHFNGLGFEKGLNLFLKHDEKEGGPVVESVNYTIGNTPYTPQGTQGERVVLLSGANSGGKTRLIQTMTQILIMAQMGFPVPAMKSYLSVFDELYYYSKTQGMLSAGAFETALKRLATLIVSPVHKFAAFDEWEAATEAEAASRVIAASLDMFYQNPNSCVIFVSHLAKEIAKRTSANIRVDGIEASGLDEQLNLMVSRTPKFGFLARSMPELIITRLNKLSKPDQQKVYQKILDSLKTG